MFLDAPHIIQQADADGSDPSGSQQRAWWTWEARNPGCLCAQSAYNAGLCTPISVILSTSMQWELDMLQDPDQFERPSLASQYIGADASLEAAQQALEHHQPVDGILGMRHKQSCTCR